MLTPSYLVLGLAALIAAYIYVRLWLSPTLRRWREHLSERGETQLSLVIITVSLIAAITVLKALGSDVPDVLTQGLAGMLFGIGGGELSVHRLEKRTGQPVHPARSSRRKKRTKPTS